jgi:hypothetical protein
VLPLCCRWPGLLKNRMYTYRWVSLMVWLYFTEGVVRAWATGHPATTLALLQKCCCAWSCLHACTLHVRLRQRNARNCRQPMNSMAFRPPALGPVRCHHTMLAHEPPIAFLDALRQIVGAQRPMCSPTAT